MLIMNKNIYTNIWTLSASFCLPTHILTQNFVLWIYASDQPHSHTVMFSFQYIDERGSLKLLDKHIKHKLWLIRSFSGLAQDTRLNPHRHTHTYIQTDTHRQAQTHTHTHTYTPWPGLLLSSFSSFLSSKLECARLEWASHIKNWKHLKWCLVFVLVLSFSIFRNET